MCEAAAMTTRALLLLLAFAACGRRAEIPPDAVEIGVFDVAPPTGPFTLTSEVMIDGDVYPIQHTCDGPNVSPPLSWINAPLGTQSFAVVLTDKTTDLIQWVIFDIPASRPNLPEGVQKTFSPFNVPGAHQTPSFQPSTRGYLGPCPPEGTGAHTYELAVYALGVASLPGASNTTTQFQAVPTIMANALETAKLTTVYAR
jgi:Raf kinase inhibitor-like YbhB/YbcL family protein